MTTRLDLYKKKKKKKKKDGMTAKDNWAGLDKKHQLPKWLDPKEF